MTDIRGSIWSDWEVDAIVADYFSMLADEMAGKSFNKSEHRRALQTLTGRDPGSIERKHQNVSAVLERLGVPFIRGYKPLAHFQNALLDAVERYLTAKGQQDLRICFGRAGQSGGSVNTLGRASARRVSEGPR